MAEGVGFEPTVLSDSGFQDQRLKPLGHPSERGGAGTGSTVAAVCAAEPGPRGAGPCTLFVPNLTDFFKIYALFLPGTFFQNLI